MDLGFLLTRWELSAFTSEGFNEPQGPQPPVAFVAVWALEGSEVSMNAQLKHVKIYSETRQKIEKQGQSNKSAFNSTTKTIPNKSRSVLKLPGTWLPDLYFKGSSAVLPHMEGGLLEAVRCSDAQECPHIFESELMISNWLSTSGLIGGIMTDAVGSSIMDHHVSKYKLSFFQYCRVSVL